MIRPSRYDTPHSDDTDVMVKIANGVALVIFLLVLALACKWFSRTFLSAAPVMVKVVSVWTRYVTRHDLRANKYRRERGN